MITYLIGYVAHFHYAFNSSYLIVCFLFIISLLHCTVSCMFAAATSDVWNYQMGSVALHKIKCLFISILPFYLNINTFSWHHIRTQLHSDAGLSSVWKEINKQNRMWSLLLPFMWPWSIPNSFSFRLNREKLQGSRKNSRNNTPLWCIRW